MEIKVIKFPAWRFAADKEPRIFESAEELEAAGDGWYDSPAKVPTASPEKQPQKKADKK